MCAQDEIFLQQKAYLHSARELAQIAFNNAVKTIDTFYSSKGAAIKNPHLLAAMITANTEIYTNIARQGVRLNKTKGKNNDTFKAL